MAGRLLAGVGGARFGRRVEEEPRARARGPEGAAADGRGSIDLSAKIPHGSGQTVLRELLLVADHTAYHVGQIVLIRQLLGIWKAR